MQFLNIILRTHAESIELFNSFFHVIGWSQAAAAEQIHIRNGKFIEGKQFEYV